MSVDIEKKFPSYFENFQIPQFACEQELEVYRACASGKIDPESFLNTYEENNFNVPLDLTKEDPQVYSMSTYLKFKDVKRFMTLTSRFGVPFLIAIGITTPKHGLCAETRKWKPNLNKSQKRNSHVDWWLYENARPWEEFRMVNIDESGKDIK